MKLWNDMLQQYANFWSSFWEKNSNANPSADVYKNAEKQWAEQLESQAKTFAETMSTETFAKGLGNGLPIAGIAARGELMDCLQANSISTFGGGPLVTAGALANLSYLLDNDLQANALRVGRLLVERLRAGVEKLDCVAEVRGKGLMIGIELVGEDGYAPNPGAASQVLELCREGGVLLGKGGLHGNCLRIAPPMSVTAEEAEQAAAVLIDALARIDREAKDDR